MTSGFECQLGIRISYIDLSLSDTLIFLQRRCVKLKKAVSNEVIGMDYMGDSLRISMWYTVLILIRRAVVLQSTSATSWGLVIIRFCVTNLADSSRNSHTFQTMTVHISLFILTL